MLRSCPVPLLGASLPALALRLLAAAAWGGDGSRVCAAAAAPSAAALELEDSAARSGCFGNSQH